MLKFQIVSKDEEQHSPCIWSPLLTCVVFPWMKQAHSIEGDRLERREGFSLPPGIWGTKEAERMVLLQTAAELEALSTSATLSGRAALGTWLRVCVTELTCHWSELCLVPIAS